MAHNRLTRFEDQIQRLVEGGFARLFAGHLHPREVAIQLARAMEDNVRETASGQLLAPDIYVVRLNPHDHGVILNTEASLPDRLAHELVELARSVGLSLVRVPEVRLLADQAIPQHEVLVSARHANTRHETTQAMPLDEIALPEGPAAPVAMLMMSENRQVTLDQPLINLGRQRDNHIIIDDSRVSRHHAQIRLRFGRFVLFDLNSTGGTTVNGQTIQEHVLQSGDVISLAGCNLIYLEENPAGDESGTPEDTQPQSPLD